MTMAGDTRGPGGEGAGPAAREAAEGAGGAATPLHAGAVGDPTGSREIENPAMKPEKDMSPWVPIIVMLVLGAAIIGFSVMLTRMTE